MLEEIFNLMKSATTDFEIRRAEALYDLYVEEQERIAPAPKGISLNDILTKAANNVVKGLPVILPLLQQIVEVTQSAESGCTDCLNTDIDNDTDTVDISLYQQLAIGKKFKKWFIENDFSDISPEIKEETYNSFLLHTTPKNLICVVDLYLKSDADTEISGISVPIPTIEHVN